MKTIDVLFVCSKNQWRSPTAEAIYRRDDRVSVRSRGTAKTAVQTIRWPGFGAAGAAIILPWFLVIYRTLRKVRSPDALEQHIAKQMPRRRSAKRSRASAKR